MKISLGQLTTSALRNLFAEESKQFLKLVDHGSAQELGEKKLRLTHICELLREREQKEKRIIKWGTNTRKSERDYPQSYSEKGNNSI